MTPLCVVLVLEAIVQAQAPSGYTARNDASVGLAWFAPKIYTEVPLPPTDVALKAKYVRKSLPEVFEKLSRQYQGLSEFRPQILVFAFGPAGGTTAPSPGSEAPVAAPDGPRSVREAMERSRSASTLDEFQRLYLTGWTVTPIAGKQGQFTLERAVQKGLPEDLTPVGLMLVKSDELGTIGVVGQSMLGHRAALDKEVRTVYKGLRRDGAGPSGVAEAALDLLYRGRDYRAVDQRKEIRRGLSKGWKAVDTPNFVIVHHSKDESLVQRIARDLEAIRAHYETVFPAAVKVETVSVVRICRTQGEYRFYGGPPGTGGYFHPGNEELVLFDYGETQNQAELEDRTLGRRLTDRDTMIVLYHEAFHQYVYYAVGQVAPHDWFNEGHGDYFSGARIASASGKLLDIGPSSWRLHRAKDQCEHGEQFVPLAKLVHAERPEFYAPQNAPHYYAAAWSFVYFLRHAPVVATRPEWAGLLTRYYDALTKTYLAQVDLAGDDPSLDAKQRAGEVAKKRALEAALVGVDLEALETAWKAFVIEMKDPWPTLRKRR